MAPKHATANLYSSQYYHHGGKKLKPPKDRSHAFTCRFIKVFYKMTTCPRQPILSGPKGDYFIQVWLYVKKTQY